MRNFRNIAVAVAFIFGTFPDDTLAAPSSTFVLAIGSNASFESGIRDLRFAAVDSNRFARAMEIVAQVPTSQIKIANNVSLTEVKATLADAARTLGESPHIKRFVLFFSGHSDERGLHFRDGLLSKEQLHSFLKTVPTQVKISILDSCFSGALAAKGVEPALDEFVIPRTDFDEPTGTVFLTASSATEAAFESTRVEGSVFSNYLITGLYGSADANGDGLVTVDELYQFIYQKTRYDNLIRP